MRTDRPPLPTTDAVELVVAFARALHRAGTPSSELERGIGRLAASLGVQAQLFATPTAIFASFGAPGRQRTALLRVEPGDVDLERLERVWALVDQLRAGDIRPIEAHRALDQLESRVSPYPARLTILAFGAVSASAAVFVGGGALDVLVAGLVGLVIGALPHVLSLGTELRLLFEPAASFLAAFLAGAVARHLPVSSDAVMIASVIVIVPGLSLTQAIAELARRDLASGAVRLAGAGTIFLTMGFGVALGRTLALRLPGDELPPVQNLPPAISTWVALAVAAVSFTVLFRAAPSKLPWIALGAAVAFWSARLGARAMGPEVGAFVGALTIGAVSNALARRRGHPPALTLLPGLILLVPGSVGLRSLTMFMDGALLPGIDAAFDMMLLAVALVAGLLTANVIVDPRPSRDVRREREAARASEPFPGHGPLPPFEAVRGLPAPIQVRLASVGSVEPRLSDPRFFEP